MRVWARSAVVLLAGLAASGLAVAASEIRKPPYWASIAAGQALMRTGPGRNYPAVWLYRRADLPVRVIEIYPSWRKVVDPDGAEGWMLVNLLSEQRTAIVRGGAKPLRAGADQGARVLYMAAEGVVGRLSDCAAGWCRFDAHGQAGFVQTGDLWGVDPAETVK